MKSLWWWFSNIVVLVGSAAYASVRQREMADKDQKSSSKVEKELHDGEKQSMVEKVLENTICVCECVLESIRVYSTSPLPLT